MISVEKSQYPIFDVIDELKLRLETDNKVILTAATGAGKSTILPLLLLDMPFLKGYYLSLQVLSSCLVTAQDF